MEWSLRSRRTAWLTAALAAAACADEPADSPPPEAPAPPEGVHGVAPPAVAGAPSVVLLQAATPVQPAEREAPRMDQLGLAFTPATLLVRVGETMRFTNSETIAHNVTVAFSDNDSTVLDYDTDPTGYVELVLEREGGYEVTCKLHPGMRAFVYATTAPYGTFADNAGSYRIVGVPPGSYTLSTWSVDPALRSERTLEVTGPSTEVR